MTRNYSEKCINSILDHVSSSSNMELLQEFYETTLAALEEAKNERLWFKTNLKLCKLWFDMREYARMARLLKLLHKSCQLPDGTDDQKKGTQLLEVSSSILLPVRVVRSLTCWLRLNTPVGVGQVYAIEIQMYTEQKNNKKLKQLYQRALTIKSAIPHPRIMGIIRECGGKMHMAERMWTQAHTDFFEVRLPLALLLFPLVQKLKGREPLAWGSITAATRALATRL